MGADIGLILFGAAMGFILGWVFRPPCPEFKPKYWERDE